MKKKSGKSNDELYSLDIHLSYETKLSVDDGGYNYLENRFSLILQSFDDSKDQNSPIWIGDYRGRKVIVKIPEHSTGQDSIIDGLTEFDNELRNQIYVELDRISKLSN